MRTLSARILLGFVALMITFGIFMGTIVVNLREVEDQASVILRGYVPITVAALNLGQREDDLRKYLDQGIVEAAKPAEIVNRITGLRRNRDESLAAIVSTLGKLDTLVDSDGAAAADVSKVLSANAPSVEQLKSAVDRLAPS